MLFIVYLSYSLRYLSLVILPQDLSIFIDHLNNNIFTVFSLLFLYLNLLIFCFNFYHMSAFLVFTHPFSLWELSLSISVLFSSINMFSI